MVEHQDGYAPFPGTAYRFKVWNAVGRYDPTCLPTFNPLAGGGLETYSVPKVALPDGQELGPTRSMAGYVNSPPLLLTTLDGAGWLANPKRYVGQPGKAFISVIRVRVSDTATPGPASQARLELVASRIHDATGLQVDVVKGSSTRSGSGGPARRAVRQAGSRRDGTVVGEGRGHPVHQRRPRTGRDPLRLGADRCRDLGW